MTKAILARDLKPGDIIKQNGFVSLVLTEGIMMYEIINFQIINFQLLIDNKVKTQTFWKDVDLVNVYDPMLIDLW